MNKEDITNAFYEVVKESINWTDTFTLEEYANFLHGATVMTDKMISMYCNNSVPCNLSSFAKVNEYGKEDVEL